LAIEIQVEKGCDTIDNYAGAKKTSKGVYDNDRKCWDTTVKEVSLKISSLETSPVSWELL
jgi:hypothetical protein